MNILSSLKVLIGADSSELGSALATTEQQVSSWSGKVGKLLAGVSFLGVGASAIAAANKFDEAFVQIGRATGAVGEKLKALEQSFTSVYKQADESSGQIATTISLLAARTQAAGKDLENLTLRALELAKTQHEDVATIIPVVTQMFGQWSIATSREAEAMEYLRVVSQQTGAPVAQLTQEVTAQAPILRALGYDWEDSTTLIGRFAREGVNTMGVLAGMKATLKSFAQEGVQNTAVAWQKLVDQIKAGKMTFDDFLKIGGARGGTYLFQAIRDGKLDVDSLTGSYKKLAAEGGASLETVHEKLIRLAHQVEAVVAGHQNLILTLGIAVPAVTSLGRVFVSLGTLALPTISNIVYALQYNLIPYLNATQMAALAAGVAMAGIGLGIAAWAATPKNPQPSRGLSLKTGLPPKPPRAPESPAPITPTLPDLSGGLGGGLSKPAETYMSWQEMIDTAGIKEAQAALQQTLKILYDWQHANEVYMPKVKYDWVDLSNHVLDFSTTVAEAGAVQAKMADAPDWSKVETGIGKTERLMAQLGETSTHALRAAYETSLGIEQQIAELYQQGYATMADLRNAATATGEAWRKLQDNINGTTTATKNAQKSGIDFGRQVSTAITDLGRSLADVVFQEKSIGDAFKDVGKAIVRIILEDIIGNAIQKLMKALVGVLNQLGGIGKALGSVLGGSSTGSTKDSSSSAGAILGSGGGGVLGAIEKGIGVITGIIGIFQQSHENTLLGRIEESTRYSKLYLQELRDVQRDTQPAIHEIDGYLWGPLSEVWKKMWTYYDMMVSGGGFPSGGGFVGGSAAVVFNNCTFPGATSQSAVNSMFSEAIRQARLAGARI